VTVWHYPSGLLITLMGSRKALKRLTFPILKEVNHIRQKHKRKMGTRKTIRNYSSEHFMLLQWLADVSDGFISQCYFVRKESEGYKQQPTPSHWA